MQQMRPHLPLGHDGHGGPDQADRREQVGVERGKKGGVVDVEGAPGGRPAGVGHHDVERAKAVDGQVDQTARGLEVGDVGCHRGHLDPGRLERGRHLGQRLLAAGGHDQASALGGQGVDDASPEPPRSSGDQRHSSLDAQVHSPTPRSPPSWC